MRRRGGARSPRHRRAAAACARWRASHRCGQGSWTRRHEPGRDQRHPRGARPERLVRRATQGRRPVRVRARGRRSRGLAQRRRGVRGGAGDHERDRRARLRRYPRHAPRARDARHDRDRTRGSGQGPHRRRLGGARACRRHARDPDGGRPHRRHRHASAGWGSSSEHARSRHSLGYHRAAPHDPHHTRCARRCRDRIAVRHRGGRGRGPRARLVRTPALARAPCGRDTSA